MKSASHLTNRWQYKFLREVAEIRSGSVNPGKFPTEVFELFSIPAYDNSQQPERLAGGKIKSNKTIVEAGDCLFSKLNPRICRVWIVPKSKGCRQIASTEFLPIYAKTRNGAPWFIGDFVAYLFTWERFREPFLGHVQASTKSRERVKPTQLLEQMIPLPPLPVQERIVQILQKADEIRRKRKEALELAEAVRRALFVNMFGEPGRNERSWPIGALGKLLDPEIERVNPALAFPDEEFTYIEIAAVKGLRITQPKRLLGRKAPSRARQVVRPGDILYSMTRPNLRNIAVVPDELDGAICTTGFCVLRPKRPEDRPFVFEIVKSDYFTEAMNRLAEAKSLYPAVDEPQIRQFLVIQPPEPARAHFGKVVAQLSSIESAIKTSFETADAVFTSLLSRAFTGELTADWEAANADWIAAQQMLYERLPRLVLLALLAEAAQRNRSALLVTALMKYVFLLQMEATGRRRFYHFVPYHYGPFAKELYADLEQLRQEGLITINEDAEGEKTRITVTDPARVQQALGELPEDLRADVAAILDQYGQLEHNRLLKTVYEKYPAYAKKSRLLKDASKPTKRAGRSS